MNGVSIERIDRRNGPSLEVLVCRPTGGTAGSPVLFLHGAFAGAWCWQESWLPHVGASGRFAAAVSLRGHGGSDGRDALRWTGLGEFLDDLTLAIDAMPSPPILVAHSLGGLLAQHLLGRVIAKSVILRGLVLVGSLPPEGLALMGPLLGVKTWLAALTGTLDLSRASSFADRFRQSGDGTWNATMAAAHAWSTGDVAFTALSQAMVPFPVPPAWSANLPTLVLHGDDDALIDDATSARTAAYHGAPLVRIPQAGHYPMLGRHATAGVDALLRWIEGIEGDDVKRVRQPWSGPCVARA